MEQAKSAHVPLSLIDPPEHMLRDEIDPAKLGELADSMAQEGLHQAIGLRGPSDAGRFEIIWGHRRTLAARSLHWEHIEAKVYPWSFDPLLAAISENLQRADLTPLEEARAIQKMQAKGVALVECARLFRRSAVWVRDRLDLLNTPQDIQEAVAARALPLAVASALARIDHDAYRLALIEEAKRTGATAATVEVWVAHYGADRERIITNHETVQQIMSSREAWVIYCPCESCKRNVDYRETRSFRFCAKCSKDVDAAIQGAPLPGDDSAQTAPSAGSQRHA